MKRFLKNNGQFPAWLMVVFGALLISFSSVYVKLAAVVPSVSGFYRVFIGGIFLLLYVFVKKERLWNDAGQFMICILAGFVFAVDLYFWHRSIHYIGPGLATVIGNFQVFFLAIGGVLFYREKINFLQAAAIPLAFAGLVPVVGFDWGLLSLNYKTGLFYGLATALSYAIYILILRQIQMNKQSLSAAANLAVTSFSASLFLALTVIAEKNAFAIPDTKSLIALICLGVFSQGVGWIFITTGLPGVRAYLAGILLLLQPSLSFVWDVLLFSRPTSLIGYAGLGVTLIAIYTGTYASGKNKETVPAEEAR